MRAFRLSGLCRAQRAFGVEGAAIGPVRGVVEVAAQHLQRHALDLDLAGGVDAQAAQQRNGRAPALRGMLEQEGRDRLTASSVLCVTRLTVFTMRTSQGR